VTFDPRLAAPLLITLILIGAHWSFGVLRGYEAVALAVGSSLVTEVALRRVLTGQSPQLASAYISGISVSILVRSPLLWPYVLGGVISVMSKFILRMQRGHLWNPSNFGICALLFLAPSAVAPLSVQWGNNLWPMLVIWVVGLLTVWRARRVHITIAYVLSFFAFGLVRSFVTGSAYAAEIAPITGPMYQLFALFMITDPKTTVASARGAVAVAILVALVEAVFRVAEIIYAPFYALFLVGPGALLAEVWWTSPVRRGQREAVAEAPARPPR
jgi:Na+-transporting NADH:ubiquinone oxidoreductase subunit NqrB